MKTNVHYSDTPLPSSGIIAALQGQLPSGTLRIENQGDFFSADLYDEHNTLIGTSSLDWLYFEGNVEKTNQQGFYWLDVPQEWVENVREELETNK